MIPNRREATKVRKIFCTTVNSQAFADSQHRTQKLKREHVTVGGEPWSSGSPTQPEHKKSIPQNRKAQRNE